MSSRGLIEWSESPVGPVLAALATAADGGWRDFALCAEADPDAWFPEKGGPVRQPKAVCRQCFVREPCLKYAMDNPELTRWGIWGGLSERERHRLRKQNRSAA